MSEQKIGKVILAGAGPGDPELVTVKTARYLRQADVVLTDRLVGKEIIKNYANPKAEIIYAGKKCGRGASTPQQTINEWMVRYASEGKLVLRLKGGDVSIFSNIMDELACLVKHEIPYEVVPGVTAALGAAAYAGIPLTARGYATAVRFLTFYQSNIIQYNHWKELAQTSDTLVFYMSGETLDQAVAHLIENNIAKDTKLAIIEQATTPLQHVITTTLYDYKNRLQKRAFISPTLAIIGRVVELYETFRWQPNPESSEEYFGSVPDERLSGQIIPQL